MNVLAPIVFTLIWDEDCLRYYLDLSPNLKSLLDEWNIGLTGLAAYRTGYCSRSLTNQFVYMWFATLLISMVLKPAIQCALSIGPLAALKDRVTGTAQYVKNRYRLESSSKLISPRRAAVLAQAEVDEAEIVSGPCRLAQPGMVDDPHLALCDAYRRLHQARQNMVMKSLEPCMSVGFCNDEAESSTAEVLIDTFAAQIASEKKDQISDTMTRVFASYEQLIELMVSLIVVVNFATLCPLMIVLGLTLGYLYKCSICFQSEEREEKFDLEFSTFVACNIVTKLPVGTFLACSHLTALATTLFVMIDLEFSLGPMLLYVCFFVVECLAVRYSSYRAKLQYRALRCDSSYRARLQQVCP